MNQQLDNIRIVLVEPSHPGNIGAAARAMKNMGLSQFYLVNPERYPHPIAKARASGADGVLNGAIVVDDLNAAIADCQLVIGTSARHRTIEWPLLTPRECATKLVAEASQAQVAIVFGREQSGLDNDELARCHYHVNIPTVADFSSLNLAAAVQVLAYEVFQAVGETHPVTEPAETEKASADEMESFFQHLEQTMVDVGFLDRRQPKQLLLRLRRVFTRARPETVELHLIRGILSAMQKTKRGQ